MLDVIPCNDRCKPITSIAKIRSLLSIVRIASYHKKLENEGLCLLISSSVFCGLPLPVSSGKPEHQEPLLLEASAVQTPYLEL